MTELRPAEYGACPECGAALGMDNVMPLCPRCYWRPPRRVERPQDAELDRPVWERCGCDQWGRCLVNCPTAHLPKWATPMGRKLGLRRPAEASDA